MSAAPRRRIFLIRHGETEWNHNAPGYCGWSDIPLNDKGRRQAEAVGRRLGRENISVVLSSDLARARVTAEAIAIHHPGAAFAADAALRELNYGEWEGKSEATLAAEDGDRFRAWKSNPEEVAPPGGETLRHVTDRAMVALQDYARKHTAGDIAVAAHKTTVRLILCAALGIPPADYLRLLQQNGAVNIIEIRSSEWVIAGMNDTCHLPGDLCSPAV